MSNNPKSNFYALFVGINQYTAARVSNLSGCVNDMEKMRNYLLRRTDLKQKYNYHFEELTNGKATRQNILSKFRSHLGQAKKGDIALFFFAGHGSTEKAHPYWETDQLETLVCNDSRTKVNGKTVRDIMDKEIRFLVNEVWQKSGQGAEIILIQDSCHSGGASRFTPPVEDNKTKDKVKENEPLEVPRRRFVRNPAIKNAIAPEESFGFGEAQARQSSSNAGTRDVQARKPFKEAYPEGQHIHLGACSPLEYAYEVNSGGVFTANLVRLLEQSKGQISYESLEYRSRMAILSGFKQQPNFSFVKTPDDKKYHQFLGSEVIQTAPPAKTYTVSPTAAGGNSPWYLNAGGVHGLRFVKSTAYTLEERQPIPIEVIDVNNNKSYKAQITNVLAERSVVEFTEDDRPVADMGNSYYAQIPLSDFVRKPVRIALDSSTQLPLENPMLAIKKGSNTVSKKAGTENPNNPYFTIRAKGDNFVLLDKAGTEHSLRQDTKNKTALAPDYDLYTEKGASRVFEFMTKIKSRLIATGKANSSDDFSYAIEPHVRDIKSFTEVFNSAQGQEYAENSIILTEDLANADFVIKYSVGQYWIMDAKIDMPISAPVIGCSDHSVLKVIAQLKHICDAHSITNLKNEYAQSELEACPFTISLTQRIGLSSKPTDLEYPIATHNTPKKTFHTAFLKFPSQQNPSDGSEIDGPQKFENLKIKLQNTTNQDYYFSALFIDDQFGVQSLLEQLSDGRLTKRGNLPLKQPILHYSNSKSREGSVELSLNNSSRKHKLQNKYTTYQLVISVAKEAFLDMSAILQLPLELPQWEFGGFEPLGGANRSEKTYSRFVPKKDLQSYTQWQTYTFTINILNEALSSDELKIYIQKNNQEQIADSGNTDAAVNTNPVNTNTSNSNNGGSSSGGNNPSLFAVMTAVKNMGKANLINQLKAANKLNVLVAAYKKDRIIDLETALEFGMLAEFEADII